MRVILIRITSLIFSVRSQQTGMPARHVDINFRIFRQLPMNDTILENLDIVEQNCEETIKIRTFLTDLWTFERGRTLGGSRIKHIIPRSASKNLQAFCSFNKKFRSQNNKNKLFYYSTTFKFI